MSEDHRTKRIVVRFTENDLAWLNEQAEDEGVEPATLVRMIVARLRKGRAPLVSMMSAAPTAPRMVQRADIADLFEDDGRTLKSLKALPRGAGNWRRRSDRTSRRLSRTASCSPTIRIMVRFGGSFILGISPSSLPAALMSRFRAGAPKTATDLRIANDWRSAPTASGRPRAWVAMRWRCT
jgi:hypothetical protein